MFLFFDSSTAVTWNIFKIKTNSFFPILPMKNFRKRLLEEVIKRQKNKIKLFFLQTTKLGNFSITIKVSL